jgi:AcrR family transcriptional regulator
MLSNKNTDNGRKRPYTLKERARRQDEVHRRITKTAVDLHRTVGPARTTVSEIARLAGVQRATVYNHFPTDLDLIDACSSHWIAENPPPDPAAWLDISDPDHRVETALAAMYAYYEQGQDMLENVLRDAPLVPALDQINRRKWWPMIDHLVDVLDRGWDASPDGGGSRDAAKARERGDGAARRAILRVVLDFFSWQTMARSGLSNDEAARTAAAWVRAIT